MKIQYLRPNNEQRLGHCVELKAKVVQLKAKCSETKQFFSIMQQILGGMLKIMSNYYTYCPDIYCTFNCAKIIILKLRHFSYFPES